MQSTLFNFSLQRLLTNRRLTLAGILLAMLVAGVILYSSNPAGKEIYPKCPFHKFTGFDCPGCGTLRGLHQLLHTHVAAAFKFNPLMVLSLPYLLFHLVKYAAAAITNRPYTRGKPHPKLIYALLVVIITYWIVRNTAIYHSIINSL